MEEVLFLMILEGEIKDKSYSILSEGKLETPKERDLGLKGEITIKTDPTRERPAQTSLVVEGGGPRGPGLVCSNF